MKLIYSTSRGLYLYDNGNVRTVSNASCFGITKHKDVWLVANTRDLSIDVYDENLSLLDSKYGAVSSRTHQIECIDDKVYVTKTDTNGISVLNGDTLVEEFVFYPNGQANMKNDNYCHFNSIYCKRGILYLMAHNLGGKTGKNSQLYVLSKANHKVLDIIGLESFSCHNCVIVGKDYYFCYSNNGTVVKNRKVLYQEREGFTRGLATDGKVIVYGANKQEPDRSQRYYGEIRIRGELTADYVCDGPVNDVRLVNFDYGLSNTTSSDNKPQ